MKRMTLFLIGFLIPLHAHAALSPWVDDVIQKIDAGLATSGMMPAISCDDTVVRQELQNNLSMIRNQYSVTVDTAMEISALKNRTLCFEADRRELQEKVDTILQLLSTATNSCQQQSSHVLRQTFLFADAAYREFLKGAVDPSLHNDLVRTTYPFEKPETFGVMSKPELDPSSTKTQCIYTTDYAPPGIGFIPTIENDVIASPEESDLRAFGCDQSVLLTLPSSVNTEAAVLSGLMGDIQTFAKETLSVIESALSSIDEILAVATGSAPTSTVTHVVDPPPPHAEQTGCLRPLIPLSSLGTQQVEDALQAFPSYFDTKNLRDDGGTKTYNPPLDQTLDRKSTRLNSSHVSESRMPSSA